MILAKRRETLREDILAISEYLQASGHLSGESYAPYAAVVRGHEPESGVCG